MIKNKKNFNLLKTMLKTSYDTSNIIDGDTGRIKKKSIKVWIIDITCLIVIYLSYMLINSFKSIGIPNVFLELFFLVLQVLVMFEAMCLVMSVMYFSNDIQNYLCLPISNMKLFVTKFLVMMSIIFGSEILIALPSIFIYGIRTIASFWFYPLTLIILVGISIFICTVVTIIMIILMRIFRFIKNKYLYQNIIILLMTVIIILPINNIVRTYNFKNSSITEESDIINQINDFKEILKYSNKSLIVTGLGVNALSKIDNHSIIYVLQIIGLDICAIIILYIIGKYTYLKDILYNLSIYNKKKNKQINLKRKCKVRNQNYAYIKNDISNVIKNPVFFMHYIYNIFIILLIVILLISIIFPILKQVVIYAINQGVEQDIEFSFVEFSLIVGIIQVLFTASSLSLTAISRYGKNAIFFKYIPIKFKTQFRLKNIPQLIVNTIIVIAILLVINFLIPELNDIYILLMFVVAMLLNIINTNILLILDLLRPQLNFENEITIIKQNDNKLFQYILTVTMCLILWYIKEVTKNLSLDISILIEIIVFSIVIIGMNIYINKNSKKLFRKII